MNDTEPEVTIITEYTHLINYDTKDPRRNLFSDREISNLIMQGFVVVTKREWWDYSELLAIANERKHRRNLAKRLRRAQGKKG